MNNLDYALKYAKRGWSIFPIHSGSKIPALKSWTKYQTELATEVDIRNWWKSSPDAGIALVCGKVSGVIVVDIDPKNGGATKGLNLPPTLVQNTGGGGQHFIYKWRPGLVGAKVEIRKGVDIRSDNSYAIIPPSLHASGKNYEWIDEDEEIADAPDWLNTREQPKDKTDWTKFFSEKKGKGIRNMSATKLAGKIMREMSVEMWEPFGYNAFQRWNEEFNEPKLDDNELVSVWESIKTKELKKGKDNHTQEIPKRERIHQFEKPESETSFDEWRKTITDNFPDLVLPSEVAASVLSQILIKDVTNPSAVVFVDVPSSGKTIAINFFSDIPELAYPTDKFTPASFVSNAANVSKARLPSIDLLPRVQYKMLMIRDLATLFSKREDDLTETLGILTRLLDGEGLNTDSGIHGQREYNGEYLFMILAASTPIPPRVWKIMGTLGSRLFFLKMNSRDKAEDELIGQLRSSAYKEKEKTCRLITKNFIQTLWYKNHEGIVWNKDGDQEEDLRVITHCAKLLSKLRGVINVWADDFENSYKYSTPVIEKPDRINQLFYNLARGHAINRGGTQISRVDLKMIIELTMDSAPTSRTNLFRKIVEYGGTMTTSEIETELNCSKPTALKEMEILRILGVCLTKQPKRGIVGEPEMEISLSDEFKWFLSDEVMSIRGVFPQPPKNTVEVETSPVQEELSV